MTEITDTKHQFQIGELAKRSGKSVRALHHYEALGLLAPSSRTKGGFRKYDGSSLGRVQWILRLQSIGFSLSEIQSLIQQFNGQSTGPDATTHARQVFQVKLESVQETIRSLQETERELTDALSYLDACRPCTKEHLPSECRDCTQHGHVRGDVPTLFAELSGAKTSKHASSTLLSLNPGALS